jgi:hypothetical protein
MTIQAVFGRDELFDRATAVKATDEIAFDQIPAGPPLVAGARDNLDHAPFVEPKGRSGRDGCENLRALCSRRRAFGPPCERCLLQAEEAKPSTAPLGPSKGVATRTISLFATAPFGRRSSGSGPSRSSRPACVP